MSLFRLRRRRRGQSLVEVAILLPLTVIFGFLVLGFWLHFNQVSAYNRAATVLAEWVARTGVYDPAVMCEAMHQTLSDQIGSGVVLDCEGVGRINTFVQIVVLGPEACIEVAPGCTPVRTETDRIGGPFTGSVNPDWAECSSTTPAKCPGGTVRDSSDNGVGWIASIASSDARIEAGSLVIVDIWGARYSGRSFFGNNGALWTMPVGHAVGYVTGEQFL